MFKNIVMTLAIALVIAGCGPQTSILARSTETPTLNWVISVTQNPATEAPLPPASSSGDECGNAYYPIVDGAQWIYTSSSTGPFTHRLTVETEDEFTIVVESGADTFNIRGLCLEGGDINLLQVPGTSLSYSGESGSSSITTTSNEGVTLPGDIQAGDDWSQTIGMTVSAGDQTANYLLENTYTAVGYETVTVPAGTFNALKIEQSTDMGGPEPMFQTLWYVQDVGMVKSEMVVSETIVIELVSYNIP